MKKYKYVIALAFTDGSIETGEIPADNYLEAMRKFHQFCNRHITPGNRKIQQTCLG